MFNTSNIIQDLRSRFCRSPSNRRREDPDRMEAPTNRLPRRFLSPLRATRFLYRGCAVELIDDPQSKGRLSSLLVEQRELLTSIATFHDLSKKMGHFSNHPSIGPAAIVYESWSMLQIKDLSERLDEVSRNIVDLCNEMDPPMNSE
eukprot:scaffold4009_cov124-Cylindrotheca_fusiformis.AAC.6